jgi:hypothetical protein
MALIILRLHPAEPVGGDAFEDYLDGLQITAFDLATNNLGGVQIGQAAYVAPTGDPFDPDPGTGIVQHFIPPEPIPVPPTQPVAQAVATAVIEVDAPPGHPEHERSDLRLEITRGGGVIVHEQVYFNAPVRPGGLPGDTSAYPELTPTSLLLALPEPGRELDPTDAFVQLPADGTPPQFNDLRAAVEIVLGHDPGGPPDLASLTPRQARHVAYEIVWNQKFRPAPEVEGISLERLYTLPDAEDDGDVVAARTRLEGERTSYYATGDAEAERLAGYVFALAAAFDGQARSEQARRVGFRLLVLPGPTPTGSHFKSVRVLLADPIGPLVPSFTVPALYLYALGATMPVTVTAEQRYRLATLDEEEGTREALEVAVDTGVIVEDPAVNAAQAARRLRSLGAVGGVAPEFVLDSDAAVQALVQAWLDFTGEDITAFWDQVRAGEPLAAHAPAHLELMLQALTDGHQPLIAAIEALGLGSAEELSGLTAEQWRALFGDPVDVSLLPAFTNPGSPEERVAAFIRHVQKFFDVDTTVTGPPGPVVEPPPTFRPLITDLLTRFADAYQLRAGVAFQFGAGFDPGHAAGAVQDVLGDDQPARRWLAQVIEAIDELAVLALAVPLEVRFSVMEALFARGFTSRAQVGALTPADFARALVGTVAYEHASVLWQASGGPGPGGQPGEDEGFQPVNPDDCLVDCIPPPHRSPLGPVAYLHELLALSAASTCEQPTPGGGIPDLADLLAGRRGPLADLLATRANLGTPLPLVDLVNESLEAVAAGLPGPPPPAGAVHDTSAGQLAGRVLDGPGGHDAATLFEALPEHGTPATPDPGRRAGGLRGACRRLHRPVAALRPAAGRQPHLPGPPAQHPLRGDAPVPA